MHQFPHIFLIVTLYDDIDISVSFTAIYVAKQRMYLFVLFNLQSNIWQ